MLFVLFCWNSLENFHGNFSDTWTEELVKSRDPTSDEMWNMSQQYLELGYAASRIRTVPKSDRCR